MEVQIAENVCGLNGLPALTVLSVDHNKSLETVDVLSDLPQLSSINIEACPKLKF